ncbi:MAG: 50S ribosomal protein L29 [Bacteriovoracaceae bacterium]|jgi:large subunit ribosomal protein L29|nr:50S ribosomal protein L29 [Bacteriovoracaceae bacterium]
MLKMSEIKGLDGAAIKKKVEELRTEIYHHRIQKHTSSMEQVHLIKNAKKDIARLLTALNSNGGK